MLTEVIKRLNELRGQQLDSSALIDTLVHAFGQCQAALKHRGPVSIEMNGTEGEVAAPGGQGYPPMGYGDEYPNAFGPLNVANYASYFKFPDGWQNGDNPLLGKVYNAFTTNFTGVVNLNPITDVNNLGFNINNAFDNRVTFFNQGDLINNKLFNHEHFFQDGPTIFNDTAHFNNSYNFNMHGIATDGDERTLVDSTRDFSDIPDGTPMTFVDDNNAVKIVHIHGANGVKVHFEPEVDPPVAAGNAYQIGGGVVNTGVVNNYGPVINNDNSRYEGDATSISANSFTDINNTFQNIQVGSPITFINQNNEYQQSFVTSNTNNTVEFGPNINIEEGDTYSYIIGGTYVTNLVTETHTNTTEFVTNEITIVNTDGDSFTISVVDNQIVIVNNNEDTGDNTTGIVSLLKGLTGYNASANQSIGHDADGEPEWQDDEDC